MKKTVFSLLVVLMLVLSLVTGTMAEVVAAFPFTAEEYAAAFVELNDTAVIGEGEPGFLVLDYEDGSPVTAAFNAGGECTAVSTKVSVALSDSDAASAAGVKLGMSTTKMLYVARYLEHGRNEEAAGEDSNQVMEGFIQLMNSMTDDDYNAMVNAPVTKEVEICGHPTTLTIGFDILEMALVMTVAYLP